jgi:NAD(P)-dependent dehydrogenase (short-subunit alcohol dehydrogenase family)
MLRSDAAMAGRTVVVTGGTSGIGLAASRTLATLGADVAIVGRNPERCASAVHEIREEAGRGRITSHVADLSLMREVRRLADQLIAQHPRIHVLVNNAGAYFARRQETSEGLERTFALNVLAPFLLTNLLQARLSESAPSRIVNVSSAAHQGARVDLADLEGRRRYAGFRAYGRSKLALIVLTHEFARRLEPTRVTANALHPGFVATRFGTNNGYLIGGAIRVLSTAFGITPNQGADTVVYLSSSPEVASVTGQYFYRRQPTRSTSLSYDDDLAQGLWTACSRLTGLGA